MYVGIPTKGEEMKKYIPALKKCGLFEEIEEENLTAMLDCLGAKVFSIKKDMTIFQEGTPAKYIGLILSGAVQMVQDDFYGNRSIVTSIGENGLFGESFACAGITSLPVSFIASKDCEIMLIDCSHILHICENACAFHQQLIYNLMKDLAKKTILFHQRIEITSKRTTREKLLTYLTLQAKNTGKNHFEIPFDRQGLADYLEVERSGLSAEIGKMTREGLIYSKKNYFELL